MKTLKLLAAIVLIAFSTTVNAQEKTEVRDVKGFTSVDVSEGIKVLLTYGDKEFVEVTADADIMDKIATEVNGSELDIYIKGNNWNGGKRKVIVKVTAIKIESLDASSGSSIVTTNTIESETLTTSVSSGASIKATINAQKVSCDASSGAHASLTGKTTMFRGDASSGSSIDASELKAKRVNADVSSGATIKCNAEDELIAEASSGGSVKYSGSPKTVDVDKSSGGSVRKN